MVKQNLQHLLFEELPKPSHSTKARVDWTVHATQSGLTTASQSLTDAFNTCLTGGLMELNQRGKLLKHEAVCYFFDCMNHLSINYGPLNAGKVVRQGLLFASSKDHESRVKRLHLQDRKRQTTSISSLGISNVGSVPIFQPSHAPVSLSFGLAKKKYALHYSTQRAQETPDREGTCACINCKDYRSVVSEETEGGSLLVVDKMLSCVGFENHGADDMWISSLVPAITDALRSASTCISAKCENAEEASGVHREASLKKKSEEEREKICTNKHAEGGGDEYWYKPESEKRKHSNPVIQQLGSVEHIVTGHSNTPVVQGMLTYTHYKYVTITFTSLTLALPEGVYDN
ncbi:unnamed protein product [Menidia menidia]|uniref:(Atlantic silverside) hypothetical protein n=1 Tax=Menidia menidia TaxID=238744 RepID=A0A8S4B8K0_9TELE|nr:unnamed protein product [Menidia menidia]